MNDLEHARAVANYYGMRYWAAAQALYDIALIMQQEEWTKADISKVYKRVNDDRNYMMDCLEKGLVQKDRLLTVDEMSWDDK